MRGWVIDGFYKFSWPLFFMRRPMSPVSQRRVDRTGLNFERSETIGSSRGSPSLYLSLDFRHIVLFRNAGNSEDWGRKYRSYLGLYTPVNVMEGMGEMSERLFQLHSRSKPFIYFWRGDFTDQVNKVQLHSIRPSSLRCGRPTRGQQQKSENQPRMQPSWSVNEKYLHGYTAS